MTVPVAGNLVPAFGNLPDQFRLALGHPAENEEGRADLRLREKPKDDTGGLGHATGDRLPAGRREDCSQILNLEPVLDIEGQQTRDHTRRNPILRNAPASSLPGKEWYLASARSMAMRDTEPAS